MAGFLSGMARAQPRKQLTNADAPSEVVQQIPLRFGDFAGEVTNRLYASNGEGGERPTSCRLRLATRGKSIPELLA
jgi:hypothetical protein